MIKQFFFKEMKNFGVPCLYQCKGKQGPCTFCGTGLCCKKNLKPSDGCTGSNGGDSTHECASHYPPSITDVYDGIINGINNLTKVLTTP